MTRTLTFAALLTLGAALAPLPSQAQNFSLTIGNAPPAPRFESVPPARYGQIWAPGFWNWDGHRHVWLAGHWENLRDGHQYQRAEWLRDGNGYRLREAAWIPLGSHSYAEVRIAPPPPRYERIPHARRGYLWEAGHWEWRGNRHEWLAGAWIAERPGYVYAPSRWSERDGRWSMEPSRWTVHGERDRDRDGIPDRFERDGRDRDHDGIPDRFERDGRPHDRDHDGIPDRRDHDRDNDGVPNRRDADRDGDGVRNDRDRRPDDPRRN